MVDISLCVLRNVKYFCRKVRGNFVVQPKYAKFDIVINSCMAESENNRILLTTFSPFLIVQSRQKRLHSAIGEINVQRKLRKHRLGILPVY